MTDEAIALLNNRFVPYAPGWGELEQPKGNPIGFTNGRWQPYEWWQDIARASRPTPNGVSFKDAVVPGTNDAWWVGTAAGQRVGARNGCQPAAQGKIVLAMNLKVFLKAYGKMPETQRRPAGPITDVNRPKLAPPPGGLCLISFDKPLMRKSEGGYCCLTSDDKRKNLPKQIPWQPGAQLDALWLTRAECESLMPKNPKEGDTLTVSSHLVKRIGLFGLTVRSAMQEFYQWNPDSVQKGKLRLTVESVSPTAVGMRLHGDILLTAMTKQMEGHINQALIGKLENRYDARLEGKLVYDPAKRRVTCWDMVVLGDYTGGCAACEFGRYGEDGHMLAREPLAIGTAFEIDTWNYQEPPEYRRAIPYMFWYFRGGSKVGYPYYFSPEKWEAEWIKRGRRGAF